VRGLATAPICRDGPRLQVAAGSFPNGRIAVGKFNRPRRSDASLIDRVDRTPMRTGGRGSPARTDARSHCESMGWRRAWTPPDNLGSRAPIRSRWHCYLGQTLDHPLSHFGLPTHTLAIAGVSSKNPANGALPLVCHASNDWSDRSPAMILSERWKANDVRFHWPLTAPQHRDARNSRSRSQAKRQKAWVLQLERETY
jgi:hypothetical protein